ncbi:hypothetical protein [Rathayibacter agropyri]|uniref:hypothetical protein n=1 Tax=Rathayibacter agropyri TaxID=1634927 RepID=UPI0015649EC0|nr:hypothetical protein [Rathayibacter agropyri]NRD08845.1 hypothetical protein [Rathayibacter agropyri]
MTRIRLLWTVAILLTAVLWAAVLAVPAVILLLPDQWQGDSVTVPPEVFVRQALVSVSSPLQTAALVMLGSLVVVAVAGRRPAEGHPEVRDPEDGWDDAVLLDPTSAR